MKRSAKRTVLAALTTLAAAASLALATASQASAIDKVDCSPSVVEVHWHVYVPFTESYYTTCFANAGEAPLGKPGQSWLDTISTGNYRVQWYGDGRWQPDGGINTWSIYSFPNHPGGVSVEKIRIL